MDSLSLKLMELFGKRSCLTLNQIGAIFNMEWTIFSEPVNILIKSGYLRIDPDYAILNDLSENDLASLNDPVIITFRGRAMLEERHKSDKRFLYSELRAWITLAIAMLALIVSIVALFL